jgi:hypothetical protein
MISQEQSLRLEITDADYALFVRCFQVELLDERDLEKVLQVLLESDPSTLSACCAHTFPSAFIQTATCPGVLNWHKRLPPVIPPVEMPLISSPQL